MFTVYKQWNMELLSDVEKKCRDQDHAGLNASLL